MNLTTKKNWKTVKLGEVVNIIDGDRGTNYPKNEEFSRDGFCLFLNTKNIPGSHFEFNEKMFVSEERDQKLRKGKLQRGDFILTTRGTVGNIAFYDNMIPFDHIRINSGMVILRPNKNIVDQKFFYYYLVSPEFRFQATTLQSGSAQPQLPIKDLKNFETSFPESLDEQREIAAVLGCLDDKIELLRKENKTLEEMAQVLFKEWFVKFNFPGATGRMIDSELGKIPEGWRVGKLGEFIDLRGGLSYDGNLTSKKGTPMVTMGFVSAEKRFEWSGLKFYIGKYKDQNKVKPGSLIIATRDVTQDRILIGSPAIIPDMFEAMDIIAATNLYIVDNINYLPNSFLYWLMRSREYRERIVGACKGTTIVMITKDSVLEYEFIVPPGDLVNQFTELNDTLMKKLSIIDKEILSLAKLRDELLNKIF